MKLPKLPRLQRPAGLVSDALEVAGIGCLVGAAWWWVPIVGLVALGVALIVIAWEVHR